MENRILTGRDLILYILKNNLEDKPLFSEDTLPGCLISESKAATLLNTGVASIRALCKIGKLQGVKIGETIYIFHDELNEILRCH